MLFDFNQLTKIIKMKYILGFAFVLFFIGCSTTREFPEDRYQPVYQPYSYYNTDPFFTPAYDYNYRDRIYYENNRYAYRNRHRNYRYDDRRYDDRRYNSQYQQQPQYRVVEPRQQPRVIEPRVQAKDKVYPDGTIKKADGTIIHPFQREKN